MAHFLKTIKWVKKSTTQVLRRSAQPLASASNMSVLGFQFCNDGGLIAFRNVQDLEKFLRLNKDSSDNAKVVISNN